MSRRLGKYIYIWLWVANVVLYLCTSVISKIPDSVAVQIMDILSFYSNAFVYIAMENGQVYRLEASKNRWTKRIETKCTYGT